MAYTTTIPGLPGGPITTSFPVHIKLVPAWRTLNRPGIICNLPRRSVQHGTANPQSMAAGEAIYLYNGAEGRQASYHMSIDDKECWVMIPFNEVTWQAADGAGPGNMNGLSNEMIENAALWANPDRARKCVENNAEMMGIAAARLGIEKPEYHWTFNYMNAPAQRHRCPDKIMFALPQYKPVYEASWYRHKNAEIDRMGGKPVPVPTPDDGEPVHPGDIVRATDRLNVRRGYGLNFPVIGVLDAGAEGTVGKDGDGRYMIDRDGYTWLNISFGADSGWAASDWLQVVKHDHPAPSPTPKPDATYAKPLVVDALYDTDLKKYDTAPAIISKDGADWVFVADVVEAIRDTPRLQYAGKGSPSIGADIKKGERFVVAWIVKAADGEFYYLSPWWSRIRVKDTKRIADAPLLLNEKAKEAPDRDFAQVLKDMA